MTLLTFPALSGQGWSVHKKPTFSTIIAPHVSGREVRDSLYLNPVWQFEAAFDGLDSTPSTYPGLGGQSFQALMGFFLQCRGQLNSFLYYDPTDYQAVAQTFGIGTGSATSFQLTRSLGGFVEAIAAPMCPAAPTLLPLPGQAMYAPNNLLSWSQDLTAPSWTLTGVSISGGVSDPVGGANAQTLSATAAASVTQNTNWTGGNAINSIWAKRRAGAGPVFLSMPNGVTSSIPVTTQWQLFWLTGPSAAATTNFGLTVTTPGDAIDVFAAHQEASTQTRPGPYFQTLQSPYFGGPSISVSGVLQDPTAYSISFGVVTFNSAPVVGSTLTWSGSFAFLCRLNEDALDFEQFQFNLWRVESVKFRSVRAQ